MSTPDYANFDLWIEPMPPDGYLVRVDSPAGQATATFTSPFSDEEQAGIVAANWSTRLSRAFKVVGDDDKPPAPALDPKALGERLFAAVFHDDVRTCLTSSLATNAKLRIRLRLNPAPTLAALPWEYLRGPAPYDFFALSAQTPIVRYLELLQSTAPLQAATPLRILVLISDPTDVAPRLNVEKEWGRLQGALDDLQKRGLIVLERLEARLDRLQQRLQQQAMPVHVLHFIGHGTFADNSQTGGLLFETSTGRGQFTSAEQLSVYLFDHPSLRLAFLNACEGARGGSTDLFAGVAQTLVQKRMPAVIAMQYTVSDDAAISLAASFYQALANTYPVDAALAEARKTVYSQTNQPEWGTPVLFMRAPDGMLFQQPKEKEKQMADDQPKSNQHINTGGGAFIGGSVNTGGGKFVGRDDKSRNRDTIITTIGDNANNVAVGKNINQANVTGALPTSAPEDRTAIEQKFVQIQQQLAKLDATLAISARTTIQFLEEELLKIAPNEDPDGGTITRMGDWLLRSAPDLTPTLGELFALPAVVKVVGKAGDPTVAWVKKRFNQ